jgi:chromosome segregation ATPase
MQDSLLSALTAQNSIQSNLSAKVSSLLLGESLATSTQTSHSSAIETLQDAQAAHTANLSSLYGTVSTLQGSISTQSTTLSSLADALQTLETNQSSLSVRVPDLIAEGLAQAITPVVRDLAEAVAHATVNQEATAVLTAHMTGSLSCASKGLM